ncbi:non-homologous end joining protein Ku [Pelagibacterium xiamenense]|uniref:non-homologous end joining protein Ku n=1 Tax=Pelagibacterium xiamenense TaxID=2901140 RepID=UPI001E2D676E|nr:Ku protein [Pelagibacterium xiamenense]MCD7058657.1 Ku protein [Pelagibacterium xiamenense]
MPSARPVWKGQIRLSLVSIPVELYSASKSGSRIRFRQIHEPSGKPVHYEKVVEGVGPVDTDDIMKGFEYEKDNYVLLTNEEIDAVRLETRKTLELTQFVGACAIDPLYFDKSYFVVPQDELAEDAFRVLRDALRSTERVGLGQLAMRGREYLAAIKPCSNGLLLETLHYEDEIRESEKFFSDIPEKKAEKDLLDVATELIERKTAAFDASTYRDHYREALREVIDTKLKSRGKKKVSTRKERETGGEGENVIDLMSALKSSLEKSGGKSRSTKSSGRKKKAS